MASIPRNHHLSAIISSSALAVLLTSGLTMTPARAQFNTSQSAILGAIASAASVYINNRVLGNTGNTSSTTVVGRTNDGGTVYGDGRIVYPNGDTLYTSNGNGTRCSYTGTYNRCGTRPVAYYPRAYNGHDHGNHYGQYKNSHRDRDDKMKHGHKDHDRDEHRDH